MATSPAHETLIKNLVKEKGKDCFRRLGAGAGIAAKLSSDAQRGIRGDDADVRRRKEAFGDNAYPKPKPKTFLGHFLDALSDIFLVALLVCAAVSTGFGIKEHGLKDGWYDGVGIFLAVFLVSSVSAAGSYTQAKQADKLARESANIAVNVVRAGRRHDVSMFDVVVGDVVILKIGDAVPADGVFLEGYGLQVDESGMTGEPTGIDVDAENNPFLAAGANVMHGRGRMLVTAVGTDTVLGELMNAGENAADDPVPLQERLERLTTTIGNIGVAVSLVSFTLLAARHLTGSGTGKTPPLLEKGVPLAVTLMVTFSMRRVVKENAMVHRLSVLETMGSVTAICADKTGTLTLNQMEVTEFWVGTRRPGAATAIAGGIVTLLRQGAGLNTTGSVYWPDNVSPPEISGSPTEKALLSWAVTYLSMDAATFKNSGKVLHLEVFDSAKEHSRAKTMDNTTGALVVHYKGAAEVVLANCSMYVDMHGASRELGVEHMKKIDKVINDMAVGGLHCMAFAYKPIDDEGVGLTLLGLLGLKDRCRPDVKFAVEACRKAGVGVKMVTTDNPLMARAIAMECGILSSNDSDGIVIAGHVFRAMPTVRQLEMVDRIRVVASSRPLDKLLVVKRLKQKGHVVAVTTGAGANDAPAVNEADVVLTMSIKGADLAAKDTIILNDKFHTVVTATRLGRCVYSNFQNFIQFNLTVNAAALVVNLVSTATTGNTSLTTVHLLWANLVIGTMSALALAVDKPADAVMERPPIARTAPLISNAMWRNLAAQVAFQIAVLLALQYLGRAVFGTDDKANGTMIFNVFVLCQVFNEFNVRDMERKNVLAGVLGKNKMFLVVVAATLVLQVLTVEALTKFAGTERLSLGQWGVCVAIAAVSWPVGWAVKFIPMTA
ncbi:hypothetical protein ACQ4PT_047057 [Festuca glaucescens]